MSKVSALARVQRCQKIHGRRTCIVLEEMFWEALEQAAKELGMNLSALVTEVCANTHGRGRGQQFSRTLRVWVVRYFRHQHASLCRPQH